MVEPTKTREGLDALAVCVRAARVVHEMHMTGRLRQTDGLQMPDPILCLDLAVIDAAERALTVSRWNATFTRSAVLWHGDSDFVQHATRDERTGSEVCPCGDSGRPGHPTGRCSEWTDRNTPTGTPANG